MQYRNVKHAFHRSVVVLSLFSTCTVGLTVAVQDNKQVVFLHGTKLGRRFHVGIFGIQTIQMKCNPAEMSAVWMIMLFYYVHSF